MSYLDVVSSHTSISSWGFAEETRQRGAIRFKTGTQGTSRQTTEYTGGLTAGKRLHALGFLAHGTGAKRLKNRGQ